MNVYLLPHHRFDPRFRYTLERESPNGTDGLTEAGLPNGLWRRFLHRLRHSYRHLKLDYDHVVHGHEQIRLSRLVLMMDRDPQLTLVIPAGMSRETALEAVRGVIRAGLMALRSHAIRNVITAVIMMIVLFGVVPTHIAGVIFYPLIALYAWGRYWEDRLIRRTMTHLLDVWLGGNGREHFREEIHLAHIEESFAKLPRADLAYREAIRYLDSLDQREDGKTPPELSLMYEYYSDIGRIDPYERYQDRIRKKLVETAKLVAHHLWEFWKFSVRWSLSMSRIGGLRFPNLLFVLLGMSGIGHAVLWYVSWASRTAETYPRFVRAVVDFSGTRVLVEAKRDDRRQPVGPEQPVAAVLSAALELRCPIDSAPMDLWPIVARMIAEHEEHREATISCSGGSSVPPHEAHYEIRVKY